MPVIDFLAGRFLILWGLPGTMKELAKLKPQTWQAVERLIESGNAASVKDFLRNNKCYECQLAWFDLDHFLIKAVQKEGYLILSRLQIP